MQKMVDMKNYHYIFFGFILVFSFLLSHFLVKDIKVEKTGDDICNGYPYDKVQIFGYNDTFYICHSGSMCNMSYKSYVAVYVNDISELKIGDIIVYMYDCKKNPLNLARCQDEQYIGITHRIININYQSKQIKPKGDCNKVDDGWIDFDSVVFVLRQKIFDGL